MRIIVLDDNIHHQMRIESALYDVARELHVQIYVECVRKLQAFKEYINQEGVNQLYFLDLKIGDEKYKGFDIAKEIRNKNPYAIIVFVTADTEAMPLVFQHHISALDFIRKDLSEEEFHNRLRQCLQYVVTLYKRKSDGDVLSYSYQGRKSICIPFLDILFIKTSDKPHRLIVHAVNCIREFYGTLNDLLVLDSQKYFQRVDRSTIINVKNVIEYNSKTREVTFFEGTTCPVSRLRIKALKMRLKFNP